MCCKRNTQLMTDVSDFINYPLNIVMIHEIAYPKAYRESFLKAKKQRPLPVTDYGESPP